ncbi:hypothetical protein [Oscillibacter sp.]|uniref:hypothetical protein n=1 Tax=Oscillibacter sp. TaxID=1945593 RepID=UPI001B56D875|nr:hypothetical protein [Oscillibacter sp.]MBP3508317.1 hypothetical protein [Oscillibacter sp.]
MHNTIYEISDKPIPKSGRATVGSLPAWFFDSVSDGACEISDGDREQEINRLSHHLGSSCTWDGKKLMLSPDIRQEYFKGAFEYFKKAASALAETEYSVFSGAASSAAFDLALQGMAESYADKFGFYVYEPGIRELFLLDTWIRSADVSKPYYVGSAIDYHC